MIFLMCLVTSFSVSFAVSGVSGSRGLGFIAGVVAGAAVGLLVQA
jgi:hypothetical protein